MSLPPELLTAALLGSERQPWNPDSSPAAGLIEKGGPAEVVLLRAIAVLAIYHQAGTLPSETTAAIAPASELETRPLCGPRASEHLLAIIGQNHPALLVEWLTGIAAVGRRAPEQYLPQLLDAGRKDETLRQPIRDAAGTRGAWLARRNPDWSWFHALPEQVDWETASHPDRLSALKRKRQSQPQQARALVEAAWKQERAEQRAELLEALQTGLSNEDEPFLEEALNDRSVVVTRVAASLLARLPESHLVQRAIAHAVPLLRLEKKGMLLARRNVLDVTLIDKWDATLERDGIQQKTRFGNQGEKASWTAQLIALVPPSEWTRRYKLNPKELLEAAIQGDWGDLLREAWALAATRNHDRDWAHALVVQKRLPVDPWASLLEILTAAQRDEILFSLLKPEDPTQLQWVVQGLAVHPAPWSVPLASRLIGLLGKMELSAAIGQRYVVQQFARDCERLITRFPVSIVPSLPPDPPELLAGLFAQLRFRAAMWRAIQYHE